MSTTEARVQAVPAVQTSKILGSKQCINSIQPENTTWYKYSPYTLPKCCRHSKYSSCPSVNIFCKHKGMELSNRCTICRIIIHTPEYTAHIQSTPSTCSTNGRNVASTCSAGSTGSREILELQGVSTVSNPEILRVRKYPLY